MSATIVFWVREEQVSGGGRMSRANVRTPVCVCAGWQLAPITDQKLFHLTASVNSVLSTFYNDRPADETRAVWNVLNVLNSLAFNCVTL